jgi:hypothetical protein
MLRLGELGEEWIQARGIEVCHHVSTGRL